MPIQQPSTQIKLTNVALVRLRKERKRFEIACYQNKVQDYRKGIEKDIDEVLQIHQVFLNVSKGQVASKEDLQKCFKTTDTEAIIKLILEKGEIQLSEKERQLMLNKITNEILTIISTKCVNPQSKKRYPPTIIHKVLVELNFNPVLNKPAKTQALDAIKLLIAKQIIPIVRAKMKIKITVNIDESSSEVVTQLQKLFDTHVIDGTATSGSNTWECTGLIDPVSYRELVTLCNGKGTTLQVLDMSVIDDSQQG